MAFDYFDNDLDDEDWEKIFNDLDQDEDVDPIEDCDDDETEDCYDDDDLPGVDPSDDEEWETVAKWWDLVNDI